MQLIYLLKCKVKKMAIIINLDLMLAKHSIVSQVTYWSIERQIQNKSCSLRELSLGLDARQLADVKTSGHLRYLRLALPLTAPHHTPDRYSDLLVKCQKPQTGHL